MRTAVILGAALAGLRPALAWTQDAVVLQAADRAAGRPLDADGRIPPRIILDDGRR